MIRHTAHFFVGKQKRKYMHEWGPIIADTVCFLSFTCCNKQLESAMKGAMGGKDLLSAADEIQKMAETTLGGKFETVVALDDFAYKSHFKECEAAIICFSETGT
ncbi:unnamed protein product [Haemonchus placei]|uniref:Ground-like domain-containing protein n=1 Tax=Haemonchus placei TaxID=6290 RepID=A0A0N4WR96_HAEPC|nr:unnamed protein product [Haemonchus placei]